MGATAPLTIFAIPKAFHRHTGVGQTNAIKSWHALRPQPRILLLGDDDGTAEIAAELGLEHIPHVQRNEFGTPLLKSVFALAHEAVHDGLMMFVNADIIVTSDLMRAIEQVTFGDVLLTGRRTAMYVRERIDFSQPDWEDALRRRTATQGRLWGPTALDYFVFPHHLFTNVPNFAIGRGWWDHWLVAEAQRRGVTVVDATPSVMVIHQQHDFLATEESIRNLALYGLPWDAVSIARADAVLKGGRLRTTPARLRQLRQRLRRLFSRGARQPMRPESR